MLLNCQKLLVLHIPKHQCKQASIVSQNRIHASWIIESVVGSKSIKQPKSILCTFPDSQQDGCELSRKLTHNLISKRIYLYEKKDYKTFFKTIHEMFPAQHWHCEIPCVQDWCGEMVTVTEIQRQLFKVIFYFPKFLYSPFSSIFYIYFISICIITFISFFS